MTPEEEVLRDALLLENTTFDCNWNMQLVHADGREGHVSANDLFQNRFNVHIAHDGPCLFYRSVADIVAAGWGVRPEQQEGKPSIGSEEGQR